MRINYYLNKRININYIIILFILSYNLYLRFITLKILEGYEKLFILFIRFFIKITIITPIKFPNKSDHWKLLSGIKMWKISRTIVNKIK